MLAWKIWYKMNWVIHSSEMGGLSIIILIVCAVVTTVQVVHQMNTHCFEGNNGMDCTRTWKRGNALDELYDTQHASPLALNHDDVVTKLSPYRRICIERRVHRTGLQLKGGLLERADHGPPGHPPQITLNGDHLTSLPKLPVCTHSPLAWLCPHCMPRQLHWTSGLPWVSAWPPSL